MRHIRNLIAIAFSGFMVVGEFVYPHPEEMSGADAVAMFVIFGAMCAFFIWEEYNALVGYPDIVAGIFAKDKEPPPSQDVYL